MITCLKDYFTVQKRLTTLLEDEARLQHLVPRNMRTVNILDVLRRTQVGLARKSEMLQAQLQTVRVRINEAVTDIATNYQRIHRAIQQSGLSRDALEEDSYGYSPYTRTLDSFRLCLNNQVLPRLPEGPAKSTMSQYISRNIYSEVAAVRAEVLFRFAWGGM